MNECLTHKNKISREKFEPEPEFKPRTSGFLARRSATWAILILMLAYVQISLLRRIPLLPGDAVITLSVIILTTSELTSPFLHEYDIQMKLLIETKPTVCLPWEILHFSNPGPGSSFSLEIL